MILNFKNKSIGKKKKSKVDADAQQFRLMG